MFTGIITDVGTITRIDRRGDIRIHVRTGYDACAVDFGASIACSGVCLTVVGRAPGELSFDVSGETVARAAPGQWQEGRRLNLERALRMGDELGGHIVTGHVDGVGAVEAIEPDGDSQRIIVALPASIAPYVAPKGSITIDGVSLTVNDVADQADGTTHIAVNIIPHTQAVTTLGTLAVGAAVNIEIDVLARYLRRMQAYPAIAM